MTTALQFRDFSADEHATWAELFRRQTALRDRQLVPEFSLGLKQLGMDERKVPSLNEVNRRLSAASGFQGVAVEGLEDASSFYGLLADRRFPIGNFIRDRKDLNYTPAPDVFHDLYGHVPFLAQERYARLTQRFGQLTRELARTPERIREAERFYWFTFEFGLWKPRNQELRIFGAGIASSFGECAYALDPVKGPERLPFDVHVIRNQEFRIDEMQKRLFVLESLDQLEQGIQDFFAPWARSA